MKYFKSTKIQNYLVRILATMIVVIIISCSMTIDSVVQPPSVNGGEIIPVTLNVKIETNEGQTSKLMIAVLVPKIWKASQKIKASFTSSVSSGPQQMTLIPAGTAAPKGNGLDWPAYLANKIGNGGNLINDWEWIAFYSNADYALGGNKTETATVSLQIPTTDDNVAFKLGYVVANSTDGLSGTDRYGSYFTGCFRVNGSGDLIDFCNPQLATVEPRTSQDNDIVTINFDAGVATNKLETSSAIYLCGKGFTTRGDSVVVCAANQQSKLTSLGAGRWRMDIWPRQFFMQTNDTTHLTRIEYYFTDITGNVKVGYGGGNTPFVFTFKCQ
ncbi:MAG: DUF4961 domain-containing protein [Ferruginibacter sp.]|nr:DUF4961 domain-containing protein [Ferruginibacter sp.]